MSGDLTSPRNSDMLKPSEIINHLLIVKPVEFVADIQTALGAKDAIRCDVVDLHQNNADGTYGVVFRGVLWFGRQLIAGLKQQMGELVLGWMQQGISKPGQNPPFLLTDAMGDQASRQSAQTWLDAHPAFDATSTAPSASGNGHQAIITTGTTTTSGAILPQAPPTPPQVASAPPAAPGGTTTPMVTVNTPTGQVHAPVAAAPPQQGVLEQLDPSQRAALEALGFKLPS